MNYSIGSQIRWSSEDFSYTGTIVAIEGSEVQMETNVGVMCFDKDDGTIALHEGALVPVEIEIDTTEAPTERKSTGLREGSKQQLVVEMMRNNPGLSRKEYINMIVEHFGMSSAGASTYHQNGKGHVNVAA